MVNLGDVTTRQISSKNLQIEAIKEVDTGILKTEDHRV